MKIGICEAHCFHVTIVWTKRICEGYPLNPGLLSWHKVLVFHSRRLHFSECLFFERSSDIDFNIWYIIHLDEKHQQVIMEVNLSGTMRTFAIISIIITTTTSSMEPFPFLTTMLNPFHSHRLRPHNFFYTITFTGATTSSSTAIVDTAITTLDIKALPTLQAPAFQAPPPIASTTNCHQ